MNSSIQPGSRQWEIVVLVARRSPITLGEVASSIGLARSSIRQQIDRLMAEGWLIRARRQGRRGRPVDIFSLSEQGRRLFSKGTDEFSRALLDELSAKSGKSTLTSVIPAVGRRLGERLRPHVGEGRSAERIRRVAELLSDRGAINDTREAGGRVRLTIHTCPYHGLVGGRRMICEMERQMVSELVGAETRLMHCMPDGAMRCELEIDAEGES